MRRFLMQGGWYGRRGRPRFGMAAAALGIVLAVSLLYSYNKGGLGTETGVPSRSAARTVADPPPAPEQREASAGDPAAPIKPEPPSGPVETPGDRVVQAPPAPRPGTMIRPVAGAIIVRHDWGYSRTMEDWRWHPGLDMAATAGTTVRAAAAGRVREVRQSKEWGWEVTIDHGAGVASRYAGCRETLVSPGQQIATGEAVAVVGDNALAEIENGAHLHFEVLVDGQPVDPLSYLN